MPLCILGIGRDIKTRIFCWPLHWYCVLICPAQGLGGSQLCFQTLSTVHAIAQYLLNMVCISIFMCALYNVQCALCTAQCILTLCVHLLLCLNTWLFRSILEMSKDLDSILKPLSKSERLKEDEQSLDHGKNMFPHPGRLSFQKRWDVFLTILTICFSSSMRRLGDWCSTRTPRKKLKTMAVEEQRVVDGKVVT